MKIGHILSGASQADAQLPAIKKTGPKASSDCWGVSKITRTALTGLAALSVLAKPAEAAMSCPAGTRPRPGGPVAVEVSMSRLVMFNDQTIPQIAMQAQSIGSADGKCAAMYAAACGTDPIICFGMMYVSHRRLHTTVLVRYQGIYACCEKNTFIE